jgi:hypothetical protein
LRRRPDGILARVNLKDWTTMAREGVVEVRRLLRELLVDRIVFQPVPQPSHLVTGPGRRAKLVYEFSGEASLSSFSRG